MEISDEWLRMCPERPSLIWHPESDVPYLPWGLTSVDIPTACFQVDTYAYTSKRIAWSMLFDLVLVFHPGYDSTFRDAGHGGARFSWRTPSMRSISRGRRWSRVYDVGWVGQTDGPLYHMRGPILKELSKSFRMNNAEAAVQPRRDGIDVPTIEGRRQCGKGRLSARRELADV